MADHPVQATDSAQNGESSSSSNSEQPASSSSSTNTAAAALICAQCNKPDPSSESPILKPCTMCHTTLYCSRDCKKAHTKVHKKQCAKLAQEYSQTHEIKMASRAPPKADTHRGGLQKWQFDT